MNSYVNCNLSLKFAKIFCCENFLLYCILFCANTVVATSLRYLYVISTFVHVTHKHAKCVTSLSDSFT